jgi:hypothetical protein
MNKAYKLDQAKVGCFERCDQYKVLKRAKLDTASKSVQSPVMSGVNTYFLISQFWRLVSNFIFCLRNYMELLATLI